jgi:hypothetical protein
MDNSPRFEWYYFDIHTQDNYDLVMTLHTRPFMSVFDIYLFDCFIYKEGKAIHHYFFNRSQSECPISSSEDRIAFDKDSQILYSENNVRFFVEDNKIAIDLEISKTNQAWKPFRANLLPSDKKNKEFTWILYVPLGKSSGKMRMSDLEIDLTGVAYHDYNAGNINLKKELQGWTWAKYYDGNAITIAGEILSRQDGIKAVNIRVTPEAYKTEVSVHSRATESGLWHSVDKAILSDSDRRDESRVDDLRLLINTLPPALAILAKIREILAFLHLYKGWWIPFNRFLTNSRYQRFKQVAKNSDGNTTTTFQEKICF